MIYNNVTASQTAPAVTTSSSSVLAANNNRRSLFIQNTGSTNVFLSFSGTATTSHLCLVPGAVYSPAVAPTNAVAAIGAAASTLLILEGR